ncbi:TPA: hypothetical protein ACGF3Z_000003 [Vibrio cholerae]
MKIYINRGRRGLALAITCLPLYLGMSVDAHCAEVKIVTDIDGNLLNVTVPSSTILETGEPKILSRDFHFFQYRDSKNAYGQFRCKIDEKNITSALKLPQDRSDPLWTEYSTFASSSISSCSPWTKTTITGDVNDIKSIEIFVNDGHVTDQYSHGGVKLDLPDGIPQTTNCSAQLLSMMDFGIVFTDNRDTIPRSTTSLVVECNKRSDITVEVNNNGDLVNSDGSSISFNYKPYHSVQSGVPLEIDISGSLRIVPAKPGSYKWYVPILVSYE